MGWLYYSVVLVCTAEIRAAEHFHFMFVEHRMDTDETGCYISSLPLPASHHTDTDTDTTNQPSSSSRSVCLPKNLIP
jgi:hypothetical protein